MIKVQATDTGYYKRLLERGEVFEIAAEKEFSARWMERVSKAKASAPEPQDPAQEPLA